MATMPVDESRSRRWQMFVFAVLGFWLSSSLMLDFVVMPSLYVSGMMDASGFAVAGYSMFGSFNRVELLCAGLGISGVWMLCWEKGAGARHRMAIILLSCLLLAIPLIDLFSLTPSMSAVGLQLDLFEIHSSVPPVMSLMHAAYFALEALKLFAAIALLRWCCLPMSNGDRPFSS